MMSLLRNKNESELFGEDLLEALFGNHPVEEVFLNNTMASDIEEDEDKYIFSINLPGFEKENLKIKLDNGYMIIEAVRNFNYNKDTKFVLRERHNGKVSRTYYLGEEIEEDGIIAEFKNGILVVKVPKKKKEETKKTIIIQ